MGKTLDFLLGRNSKKTSKLKTLLGLNVSRLAILRNHRQVRQAQSRGDVAQLLQLGDIDRALLRVEHVIKEQNMLQVFVMIEGYCHLIRERDVLLEHQRECPEELREAISSLIFAGSRCGDLPELQSARCIFASKFGKEFTVAATELRNNCGVNPKMVQKLSTRQPSLENRQRVMKEIAAEKGIKLDFGEASAEVPQEDPNLNQRRNQSQPVVNLSSDTTHKLSELDREENLSLGGRQRYKDVVSAAQAAFESAAYAAAAARAAVELSRSESQERDSSDQGEPDSGRRAEFYEQSRDEDETLGGVRDDVKIHTVQSYGSESEEEIPKKKLIEKSRAWLERSSSSSSSDSTEPPLLDKNKASNEPGSPGPKGKEILFDKSDSETEMDWNLGAKPSRMGDLASDEGLPDRQRVTNRRPAYLRKAGTFNVNDSLHEEIGKVGLGSRNEDNTGMNHSDAGSQPESVPLDPADNLPLRYSNVWKKAVSMRTRRGF
ncbi:IST1-like protein [Cocos nucifera]|uniref:IST1-like protein n=1 Tax=Cocos nucifera TaxID=13894 RepID=A0A8K0HYY8_COCNU|nr:IST1-like protein [Cocos nucifera]